MHFDSKDVKSLARRLAPNSDNPVVVVSLLNGQVLTFSRFLEPCGADAGTWYYESLDRFVDNGTALVLDAVWEL